MESCMWEKYGQKCVPSTPPLEKAIGESKNKNHHITSSRIIRHNILSYIAIHTIIPNLHHTARSPPTTKSSPTQSSRGEQDDTAPLGTISTQTVCRSAKVSPCQLAALSGPEIPHLKVVWFELYTVDYTNRVVNPSGTCQTK